MKVLVVVLTLTAVSFASSTVYLARWLYDVRSGNPAGPVVTEAGAVTVAAHEGTSRSSSSKDNDITQPSGAGEQAAASPTTSSDRDGSRSGQIQHEMSAAFMKRWEDPEQRAEMLAEETASQRRVNRRLGDATGLSEEETRQLFEMLARHQLEVSAAVHACTLDRRLCDIANFHFPDEQRQVAEVAALFGPERYRKYQQFRESRTERQLVDQLRLKVIDSVALRNSEAEKLIDALWEEKSRFLAEAKRRGARLTTVDTSVGPVIMNASEQGRPRGIAPEMAEFQTRMYARAAQVLDPEQLRVFKEFQDQARRSVAPRRGRDGAPAAPD